MLKVQATVGVDPTDRFERLSQLGKGSYGTVYKARDKTNGEVVAIKVVNYDESGDAEGDLSVVAQEIQMLADCNHPNIVRYQGSYRHGKSLWIVMEHCGGGSVSDLIQAMGSNLTEDQVAYICGEALEGLAYLHNLGKVHRDIKCGNILLTDSGEVKLADFGVAAQLTKTMSKRNTFIGTPHWMAPEVIQESRYDGKVDLWALGISAIEMAEKLPPRWGVHALRVIFMISREPPPQLKDQSKWSPLFHDFIARCLVKDPLARPTARLMLQHRFVAQIRPEVRQSLLPLIAQAEQAKPAPALTISPTQTTSNATATTDATASPTPLTYKGGSMLGGHGTVRTSLQFRSKKTIPTSTRTMLSPTSPWQQANTKGAQGHTETSGTLVVKDGPASVPPSPALITPGRAGDYKFGGIVPSPLPRPTTASNTPWSQAGTMLVNSNTTLGSAGMTIKEEDESDEDEEEGSYMAALKAASKESGGYAHSRKATATAADSVSDYMAAVQAAAREPTPRGATPQTTNNQGFPSLRASDAAASTGTEDYMAALKSAGQGTERRPQTGQRSQPMEENWRQIKHSKLIEKLQALHEGGLIPVVPVLAAGIVPPLSQLRPLGPPTAVRAYQDMDALVNGLPEQLQATMAFSQAQTARSLEKSFSAKQVMSTMLQQQPALAKLAAALSYQHHCQRLPDNNTHSKNALAKAAEESCDTLSYFLCT